MNFNSLAPCGANPFGAFGGCLIQQISTHSPRAGRTLLSKAGVTSPIDFNSLAPCGANPIDDDSIATDKVFQLTRPVRGEPLMLQQLFDVGFISTHSPRAGRTYPRLMPPAFLRHFNSLAPCGANPVRICFCRHSVHFNSLAPCGANLYYFIPKNGNVHFNSLAPCGANLDEPLYSFKFK